ncbi:hypothetical protein HN51_001000 [Arachis hypogaea]
MKIERGTKEEAAGKIGSDEEEQLLLLVLEKAKLKSLPPAIGDDTNSNLFRSIAAEKTMTDDIFFYTASWTNSRQPPVSLSPARLLLRFLIVAASSWSSLPVGRQRHSDATIIASLHPFCSRCRLLRSHRRRPSFDMLPSFAVLSSPSVQIVTLPSFAMPSPSVQFSKPSPFDFLFGSELIFFIRFFCYECCVLCNVTLCAVLRATVL